MPKPFKSGIRISVWIPPKQRQTAIEIENLSRFFQICLDRAPDIMAWAILREVRPEMYDSGRKLESVIDEFNKKNPLDPLTAKRLGKNVSRTQPGNDSSNNQSNPALR